MEFLGTVTKNIVWKNEKGQFIGFAEYPQTFWKWGASKIEVGKKYKVSSVSAQMGTTDANERITEIVPEGETQTRIAPDSAIAQAQKSTGAFMKTPVAAQGIGKAPEKNSDFFLHEVIAKQAEKIVELVAVTEKMISRLENLENHDKMHFAREEILQNKVQVSFI